MPATAAGWITGSHMLQVPRHGVKKRTGLCMGARKTWCLGFFGSRVRCALWPPAINRLDLHSSRLLPQPPAAASCLIVIRAFALSGAIHADGAWTEGGCTPPGSRAPRRHAYAQASACARATTSHPIHQQFCAACTCMPSGNCSQSPPACIQHTHSCIAGRG